jgi:Holliday junction resolvasome RuvABC endonuclease subunit
MTQSASKLGELSATVRLWSYWTFLDHKRFPLLVPPPLVKKFATGRGNAKKNEVMLAVYKKWKVEYSDDNMADSYVIAQIACGRYNHDYEQAVLAQLDDPKFRDQERV